MSLQEQVESKTTAELQELQIKLSKSVRAQRAGLLADYGVSRYEPYAPDSFDYLRGLEDRLSKTENALFLVNEELNRRRGDI